MKSKLLPILLFSLLIMNGVLIFMLIKKPHEKPFNSERNFLTEQLQFTDVQKKQFRELDKTHRSLMMSFDAEIIDYKDVLFNSFSKENFNSDAIANQIGILEAKKEVEVFHFFSKVRKICTKTQVVHFDKIIKKALKKGDQKPPPRNGREHPPREEGHRPPR